MRGVIINYSQLSPGSLCYAGRDHQLQSIKPRQFMLRGSVINKFSQLSPGSFIHSVGISNETSFSYPQTIHAEAEEGHRWAFVRSTATLRYEPCTQFINVSQRALHIYWQFSAMSHAIHKIVSKRRCQSYFSSRRSPHHGKNKNRDL